MTVGLLSVVAPGRGAWNPVKIGAGGYVTGIDMLTDGSIVVCRTDTAGAYIWNANSSSWAQLVTAFSMRTSALDDRNGGVSEIKIAPSNPKIIYMAFQGDVWKSINGGNLFFPTGLNYLSRPNGRDEANNTSRIMGWKMAVDPANADIVYMGTPTGGCYRTTNGGASWSQIGTGSIPACNATFTGGTNPGHPGICFDPTSGITGGATNKIYVPSYGNGVYLSTDAGATWALAAAGGPTQVSHAKVHVDGIYYCANVDASAANAFWKFASGSWTNISSGCTVADGNAAGQVCTIVCDPTDATRIIAANNAGQVSLNTNRGASGSWGSKLTGTRNSPLIQWLAWTLENYMSLSDMVMDSNQKLWFAEGIGPWTVTFTGTPSAVAWNAQSIGIENLTTNCICIPPNNKPLLAGWDRSVFRVVDPNVYPGTHSPDNLVSIRHAWDIDYASSDATFAAYLSFNNPAGTDPFGWTTPDNGVTWAAIPQFPGRNGTGSSAGTLPTTGTIPLATDTSNYKRGGSIACSTALNWVAVPSNSALPWHTKDGGSTWAEILISGVATSGETGYGNAYYSSVKTVAADRVTANCFYLYNYLTQRCYRSTDSGDNWTNRGATIDAAAVVFNYKLMAVPGNAGHLFLSGGSTGNPGDANPGATLLTRSTDGGATWTRVGPSSGDGCIKEPWCVGFGAIKSGQSYPSICFVGWLQVSGQFKFGIWESFDNCSTWRFLGDWPVNLDAPKSVDGSKENYGEWYIALAGSGYMRRSPD